MSAVKQMLCNVSHRKCMCEDAINAVVCWWFSVIVRCVSLCVVVVACVCVCVCVCVCLGQRLK